MTLKGIEPYTIKTYHTDRFGKASPATFAAFFEEATSNNVRLHGFHFDHMLPHNVAWVLSRLTINVDHYPETGDTVTIHTWPSAHAPSVATRCFEVYDSRKNIIAEATASWLVIDLKKRRLIPLPDYVTDIYPKKNPPCKEFPTRVVPRLREAQYEVPTLSRKADIDMNGHVNNVQYFGWIEESVPEKFLMAYEPALIDVSFRQECGPHQELLSKSAMRDDGDYLHSVVHKESGKELCRARTEWRKRKPMNFPYTKTIYNLVNDL